MIDHSAKIIPVPTPETAPYWQGCRDHELLLQRCVHCCRYQFYPRIMCSHCMSDELLWIAASGKGKVVSFTVVRRAVSEGYRSEVPYVVALVRLDEGPTMMTNVIDCEPGQVEVGMPVAVYFEEWNQQITIPKFRPLSAGGGA